MNTPALSFESPEQLYVRVFRMLKPRTAVPVFRVDFCAFAGANSFIRLQDGAVAVRITDVLKAAPAAVMEALAVILLSRLYGKKIPRAITHRYRLYLNRRDVREQLHNIRKQRGRKLIADAKGRVYDLIRIFEEVNLRFFGGMMARPDLGWSLRPSRTTLGHYDPSHHAIVLSRILDRPDVPAVAVEYVMFHEMLHLRYPTEHRGVRRCIHTPEFKKAEREFPQLVEAKEALARL